MSTSNIEDFIRAEILDANLEFQLAGDFRSHTQLLRDEALKRGWETVSMGKGVTGFYNAAGLPVGTLQHMLTSVTASSAVNICSRKHIAKAHFRRAGVPIATGSIFPIEDHDEAKAYFLATSAPVVMKPDRGAGGAQVVTGVTTPKDFDKAWSTISAKSSTGGAVLIEEQFSGIDIRAMVVGGKYVAASSRVPGFVVGDGETTFEKLVKASQIERRNNAYLKRMLGQPDYNWLSRIGINNDTVLEPGKIQILNLVYNLHQGGINVDVTRRLPEHFIAVAEAAASSIPGLAVAGVDLMISGFDDDSSAIVLEANTAANIAVHHYPAYGEAVDVAAKILDLLEN